MTPLARTVSPATGPCRWGEATVTVLSTFRRHRRRDTHLYESHGLRDLVTRLVPVADLSDLPVPAHVVTTDLFSGEPVWWTHGDPRDVLVASASLPGLLPPVALGDSLHVDGGVTCPVPVQRAIEIGADRIWLIDVTGGALG